MEQVGLARPVQNKKRETLGIYLHIPFCMQKCQYCDFLSAPAGKEKIERYIQTMQVEMESYAQILQMEPIDSIFMGGGTPSLLCVEQTERLFQSLYALFRVTKEAEITIECNPGTLTKEKLLHYKALGVNRLSLGLQSVQDEELKNLGRIHTYSDFLESYHLVRQCGFSNVNIDVMSALPGQSLSSWEKTCHMVAALKPEHISAYSLILEEGTALYERSKREDLHLPSEETERQMYERTGEILNDHGYMRYEISNYARQGYECRHNIRYWTRQNYIGIGLGASSCYQNVRYKNRQNHTEYETYISDLSQLQVEREILTKEEQMEEFMYLGLRMIRGVRKDEFQENFGVSMDETYGKIIKKGIQEGWLSEADGRVFLTNYGIDVSNYVLAEFLLS